MSKPKDLSEAILQVVRCWMGVEAYNTDTSSDEEIRAMPARGIVRAYFGWHLGDEAWADDAIHVIEAAYGIKLEEPMCEETKA